MRGLLKNNNNQILFFILKNKTVHRMRRKKVELAMIILILSEFTMRKMGTVPEFQEQV